MRIPRAAAFCFWTPDKVQAEAERSGRTVDEVLEWLRATHPHGHGPPKDLLGALFERYPLPGTEKAPKLTDSLDFELPECVAVRGWTKEMVRVMAWAEARPVPSLLRAIEDDCRFSDGRSQSPCSYANPDQEAILAWPEKTRALVASLEDDNLPQDPARKRGWWRKRIESLLAWYYMFTRQSR
jgi:hypothetical protein